MKSTIITAVGLSAVVAAAAIGGCTQREEPRRGTGGHVEAEADSDSGLPGRVVVGFRREFPDGRIKDARKLTHADGTEHWEVRYVAKDGQAKTAEFDAKGRLVR